MSDEAKQLASDPEHVQWARNLAKEATRKAPPNADRAAIDSAAMYALCVAAMEYDPDSGVPFMAWATQKIRWRIADEFRKPKLSGLPRRGAKLTSLDAFESHDLEAIGAVDPPSDLELFPGDTLDSLLWPLYPAERRLMRLLYSGPGMTQKQAAAALGITQGHACQTCIACVEELRRALRPNWTTEAPK